MCENNKRYRVADLARLLQVTPNTVQNWIQQGLVVKEEGDTRPWVYIPENVEILTDKKRNKLCKKSSI